MFVQQPNLQELLDLVRQFTQVVGIEKLRIGQELGRRAKAMGKWGLAIDAFNTIIELAEWNELTDENHANILRDLGVCLTKANRDPYLSYLEGRKYLERALELNEADSNTLASLGGSWKFIEDNKAYEYYLKALEMNPEDPYPLVNVIIYEEMDRNQH